MFAIQLIETMLVWAQAGFILIAVAGTITLLATRKFGALFVYLLVCAIVGVFVYNTAIFRAASEKVCEQTADDLTVRAFNCAPGSGGVDAPVIEVDD